MDRPIKVIVNEYKSLDDELEAIIAGIFADGRQSVDWKIDVAKEVTDNLIPLNKDFIKQAFKKWGEKDQGQKNE